MSIFALDLGSNTGWADESGAHGVWRLGPTSQDFPGDRLLRLRDRLTDAHTRFGISALAYEESHQVVRGLDAMKLHSQLVGVVLSFAAIIRVPCYAASVGTIKAIAGSGRYQKHDMIRAAKQKLGIIVEDDNECDAIWLLKLIESGWRPAPPKRRGGRRRSRRGKQAELFR